MKRVLDLTSTALAVFGVLALMCAAAGGMQQAKAQPVPAAFFNCEVDPADPNKCVYGINCVVPFESCGKTPLKRSGVSYCCYIQNSSN